LLYSLDYYTSNSLTSCGNALFKQLYLYLARKQGKEAKKYQNKHSAKPKMASIYEKPPLFKLQKTWNEKTILPEVYKLTSPNPCNKNKAEIHKDSGLYGIEFTVDKTIPDFNKGADKVELDHATAFVEFENVLEGALNSAWKYVLKEHFPEPIDDSTGVLSPESNNRNSKERIQRAIELFLQHSTHEKKLRDRQLIYYQPGGNFQVRKDLGTSAIEHRHRFDELLRIAELLPEGDIAMPNKSLTLEWFYMTFHKSERDQFITSGQRLVDETIKSVTEYFKSLYNIKKSSVKLKIQLDQRDRKKYEAQRGSTKNRYDDKMRNMADERRTSRSRSYRDDRNHDRGYKSSRDSDYKRDKSERKAPPEFMANLATSMATRPSTPTMSAAINPKIASRAEAIATTTTTESAAMTHTITTNATSVAKMSFRTNIVCRSRATMTEGNQAQAAETASATRKITMSIQVKYLEKRGRSVCPRGPHLVRIFEMRSHLIPRSM